MLWIKAKILLLVDIPERNVRSKPLTSYISFATHEMLKRILLLTFLMPDWQTFGLSVRHQEVFVIDLFQISYILDLWLCYEKVSDVRCPVRMLCKGLFQFLLDLRLCYEKKSVNRFKIDNMFFVLEKKDWVLEPVK